MDDTQVLATVRASNGRRVLGIGSLAFLGIFLIYVAFFRPPTVGLQVFLIVIGAAALWCAMAMYRATAGGIELTQTELRDLDGTLIAAVADIQGIDRGFLAFKPSNGFLIKIVRKDKNQWRPGMWWRLGRRVGVGGMTPGSQTKVMAEIILAMVAQREG